MSLTKRVVLLAVAMFVLGAGSGVLATRALMLHRIQRTLSGEHTATQERLLLKLLSQRADVSAQDERVLREAMKRSREQRRQAMRRASAEIEPARQQMWRDLLTDAPAHLRPPLETMREASLARARSRVP